MLERLLRPGVYAFYGYGLRQPDVQEMATAIRLRFAALFPGHPASTQFARSEQQEGTLCPTRLWPVLLDDDERPIFALPI